jgi:LAS superfamily LD-carboxypeptidase LdcB
MIRHTVVFRLKHAKGSAEEHKFLADSMSLAKLPTVRKFEQLKQVSPKNAFHFGFSMEFDDQAAYDAYNTDPVHVAYVKDIWIPQVAEFMEIDYVNLN